MGNYILSHCRFYAADAMLAIFAAIALSNRYVTIYQLEKDSDGDLHEIAMVEGDPVDVALSWATTNEKEGEIPVINMANDKKPGGDWESSSWQVDTYGLNADSSLDVMAPEENLCRRSNLVATLNDAKGHHSSNYPIPPRGGIYSQHVGKYDFPRP